jgi:hypothetical protein
MKALLLIAAIAAAVAVAATSALASTAPAAAQGINVITDTLGGKGQPDTMAPTSAEDAYHHYAPGVGTSGSGFYRAHLAHIPAATATPSGDGFSWGDAGVGAVTGFGALFLVAGMTLLVRRRNDREVAL